MALWLDGKDKIFFQVIAEVFLIIVLENNKKNPDFFVNCLVRLSSSKQSLAGQDLTRIYFEISFLFCTKLKWVQPRWEQYTNSSCFLPRVPAGPAPGGWGPPPPPRWLAPHWGGPAGWTGSRSAAAHCSAPCSPGRCVYRAAVRAAEWGGGFVRNAGRFIQVGGLHHLPERLYQDQTFFMKRLSCLEHLSTLSFSTEMSEMTLCGDTRERVTWKLHRCCAYDVDIFPNWPYVGELGGVVVPVNEAQENLEDQQPHLRILVQREGQQWLQEGAGQSRQHVGGLETCRHLEGTFRVQRPTRKKEKNHFWRH